MASVAFLALFSPLPGSSLVGVTLVVVVAEIHRAISKRGGLFKAVAGERVMSILCDFVLKDTATPAQLTTFGSALWRWCNRSDGARIYQYLDNQALADLIAGKFPAPLQSARQTGQSGIHLRVRDELSHDRQAIIESLRRAIPVKGVEDIVVDGASWNDETGPGGWRPQPK
jgi:hypothetical protein